MSLNQILKWLLEQVAPMLIQWLMQLIDLYFPYQDNRRYEFKRKFLCFVQELSAATGSKKLSSIYTKQSIKVNKAQYDALKKVDQ